MQARLVSFGEIELEGERYGHDIVIERGEVRKRNKKPSRIYREQFGHTPLSPDEDIPWRGRRLLVGTGVYGKLPVMEEFYDEAERRGIEIIARPTEEICARLGQLDREKINAILHITC